MAKCHKGAQAKTHHPRGSGTLSSCLPTFGVCACLFFAKSPPSNVTWGGGEGEVYCMLHEDVNSWWYFAHNQSCRLLTPLLAFLASRQFASVQWYLLLVLLCTIGVCAKASGMHSLLRRALHR